MVLADRFMSKQTWKGMIWSRAWDLEKIFWTIQNKSHESLLLIEKVCHTPRYLVWWELSDIFPDKMGMCEIMAKLVCRCSMLKADDLRLRNLTVSYRWCEFCQFSEVEDAKHLILNCPETQSQRDILMKRIDEKASGCGVYDQISFVDKFHILLGSVIPGLDINQMVEIWFTSAYFIGNMYKQRIKTRKGVG